MPSRLIALVGSLAAVIIAANGTTAAAARLPAADRSFVDTTVRQAMQSERLPGVMIKITGPRGSYEKTYGLANTRTRAPMAAGLRVRIASITKTFTATAVLQQVQRRRLSLSDKLDRWVKGIPNGRRITVRELLAMRSGIYDFTSDPAFNRAFDANPLLRFKPTDIIPIIRRHKPLFAPGTRTQYADSNYVLLGIILQKVTGQSAESVITRDVIRRAGLRHTSFPTSAAMPTPYAHGYFAGADGKGRLRDYTRVNPKVAWTAGGMVSTLGDLEKWGRALATGTLLSRRLQAQRLQLGTIPNGTGPPVGYGLGILRFGNWLGHDGAILGFSTATFYERRAGAQITAVANLSSNFSTPTLAIFGVIAQHLYPSSLTPARTSTAPDPGGDRYTPLIQSVMSTPRWFTGTDRRVHLTYELQLINDFPVPVTLESVVVRDRASGRPIERLQGSQLRASMSPLANPGEPISTVPGSGVAVVWFDVVMGASRDLPRSIVHTLTVKGPAQLPVPPTIVYSGAAAKVDRRPPAVIGPPLRGPGWIAVGSCCDGPHRRSLQPVNGGVHLGQRFAIDWNGFDAQRRFVVGTPDLNASWIYYGKPVIAVADARVATAVDRFPDQIPNHEKPVAIEQADGNYVILALGRGRYAFYAHLKPGSIRVKAGQRVHRGEVIGELGNSGSSSGPHLHFQMMDRASALDSDGLPFVIHQFQFDGQIPPLDKSLTDAINAGKPVSVDPAGAGPRSDELPLGRDVVSFPAG